MAHYRAKCSCRVLSTYLGRWGNETQCCLFRWSEQGVFLGLATLFATCRIVRAYYRKALSCLIYNQWEHRTIHKALLPSAPSTGTGIPQSKSRVIARGCKFISSQLFTLSVHVLVAILCGRSISIVSTILGNRSVVDTNSWSSLLRALSRK